MILKSVRLQNFRYVKDSENFKVDESVTCRQSKHAEMRYEQHFAKPVLASGPRLRR